MCVCVRVCVRVCVCEMILSYSYRSGGAHGTSPSQGTTDEDFRHSVTFDLVTSVRWDVVNHIVLSTPGVGVLSGEVSRGGVGVLSGEV